jgi:hypothetical protein
MAAEKVEDIRIEWPDLDRSRQERIDDGARGNERSDAPIEEIASGFGTVLQQMMPDRVEAGLRVLDRPADPPLEGIRESSDANIGPHDEIRAIDRPSTVAFG